MSEIVLYSVGTISDIIFKEPSMNIQLSEHFTYSKLLKFTLPSMVMMVFTSIYGVVDGVFVSNYVGSESFAAVNLIMPFLMILGAVGFMLGSGGSALVSYTLGTGDSKRANEIFSLLIYVLIGLGAVFTVGGILFLAPMSRFLGADETMLPICVSYGRIVLSAMIPFMLQSTFQSFLVTAERPNLGLYVTVAAGVANMVLDTLFIAVFKWGVIGAALATAISQWIGGVVPLLYFALPNKSKLHLCRTQFDLRSLIKASTNGASEFMTNISMSIVNMLYNWQLMRLSGSDGVAVYGVIMYVSFIFAALFIGYSMGSAPIVGYHCGAGNKSELKNLLGKSFRLILTFQIILTIAAEAGAPFLAGIFVRYNTHLLDMTVHAFRSYSISFLFMGFSIYASSFFTALNDGGVSAAISFCRTMIFETGAVIILPFFLGVSGIWYSIIAAEFMAVCLSLFFLIRKAKKYGYT